MPNNLLQWNPGQVNQENDATYAADAQRTGGAAVGQAFPSPLANKVLFQVTTLAKALGDMLSAKGLTISDNNVATLASVLSALQITSDVVVAVSLGSAGYIRLGPTFGGFLLQWKGGAGEGPPAGNTNSDITTQSITWPLAFPVACFVALVSTHVLTPNAPTDLWYQTQGWNVTSVTVMRARSHNDAGRQGDYTASTQPFVIGIGH